MTMKFDDVVVYNEKTKALTLVTKIKDIKTKEVEVKTYQYPFFVKGIYTKKAIDLGVELEEAGYVVTSELFDRLASYFTELYGKQFTANEFINGVSQDKIVNTFITMLFGVLQGDSKNE